MEMRSILFLFTSSNNLLHTLFLLLSPILIFSIFSSCCVKSPTITFFISQGLRRWGQDEQLNRGKQQYRGRGSDETFEDSHCSCPHRGDHQSYCHFHNHKLNHNDISPPRQSMKHLKTLISVVFIVVTITIIIQFSIIILHKNCHHHNVIAGRV